VENPRVIVGGGDKCPEEMFYEWKCQGKLLPRFGGLEATAMFILGSLEARSGLPISVI